MRNHIMQGKHIFHEEGNDKECGNIQTANIRRTLVGNKLDHSGVVRESPIGTVPTTSPFST